MSAQNQHSIQLSEATQQQIAWLREQGHGNRTAIIRTAVDRMYREESARKGEEAAMGNYFNLSKVNISAVTKGVRRDVPKATETEVEAFIDADWPNAQEHQDWLNHASSKEIADWVAAVMVNTHPSMVSE